MLSVTSFVATLFLQNVLAAESGIIINISDNETKADITVDTVTQL